MISGYEMSKSVIAISAFVVATALAVCLVFFFFFVYKPAPGVDARPTATPTQPTTPAPTPAAEIPNPEIRAADVSSVSINTVYKGYFQAGDKCAKTYNEYFGNNDGIGSPSSPCTINITFDRDGRATRSVEISRWDKTVKEKHLVELIPSSATITLEQFNTIAQAIVSNEAFKAWREGTMINVSNCSITVVHTGGTKTVMSNVDERAVAFLPMVQAFQSLETQTSWKAGM